MKRNNEFQKGGNTCKPLGGNACYIRCGKSDHFIKDCPVHNMEYKNYMTIEGYKGKRKDRVPDKSKRRVVVNYIVKQALATLGDSSYEFDKSEHPADALILVVEKDNTIYNSLYTLMEKSDDDEEDKVTLLDIRLTSMTIF